MANWYCYVDGKQFGPLDDATLRQWLAEGRVKPADHVWHEGMTDWLPAGRVGELADVVEALGDRGAEAGAPSGPRGSDRGSLVPAEPVLGTGGSTGALDLLSAGWRALSGQWLSAIGVVTVAYLILLGAALAGRGLRSAHPALESIPMMLLGPPVQLGLAASFLMVLRGQTCDVSSLLSGFREFTRALGVSLLGFGIICLAGLAAALPGLLALKSLDPQPAPAVTGPASPRPGDPNAVDARRDHPPASGARRDANAPRAPAPHRRGGPIARGGAAGLAALLLTVLPPSLVAIYLSLAYSQAMFLIARDSRLGAWSALGQSRQRMRGHKLRLALLCLATIPIFLLGVGMLVVGVLLFSMPWVLAAMAAFHDDLLPPART
jgi:uncharacterized membrane protein